MNKEVPKKGVLAALWTPTRADGTLLREALVENLEFLKNCEVNGVLALGSTGAFPYYSVKQRKAFLSEIADLASPLPVVGNVSDIDPGVVADLARHAAATGVSSIAIMAPGFFSVTQDELLEHFLNAADASGLPCLLYNFPELSGTRIELETIAAFGERAPLLGVKQSGADFGYHADLIALAREKSFSVFSGSDTRLPEVFSMGADGCIGGLVNILPEMMVHLFRVCHDGVEGALEPAVGMLVELGEILERVPFPMNVAAGMEARGFSIGSHKMLVSNETKRRYGEVVEALRQRFDAWNVVRMERLA